MLAAAAKKRSRPLASRATFPPIRAVPDLHLSILDSWQSSMGSFAGRGDLVSDVGATALALLTHAASTGRSRTKNVKGALRWLVGRQKADGSFGGSDRPRWLIDHVLATCAMIEHGSASKKSRWWMRVRKAVARIVAESRTGYHDRLTASLAVIALVHARRAGIEVPEPALDAARRRLVLRADEPVSGTGIAAAILARYALG